MTLSFIFSIWGKATGWQTWFSGGLGIRVGVDELTVEAASVPAPARSSGSTGFLRPHHAGADLLGAKGLRLEQHVEVAVAAAGRCCWG